MHPEKPVRAWRADEGASRDVLVALYLRDALGILDPSGLPRLLGTGLSADPAPVDEMSAWAWTRWWVSVIEPDAQVSPLPEHASPAWESVVRRHLDDARTWADVAHDEYTATAAARGPDDVLGEVVAEWEAAHDRPARPFRLRVEVLPLTAAGVWWVAEDAIAVDEMLRAEPLTYRDALAPIVDRLA